MRWPEGFICPRCQNHGGWTATRGRVVCGYVSIPSLGNGGDDLSRYPQTVADVVSSDLALDQPEERRQCRQSSTSIGLGKLPDGLGLVAQTPRAMVRPGRDRLHGRVEVDETYVGGEDTGKGRGRYMSNKALVVVAAEEDGRNIGRIRMARIPEATREHLHGFIRQAVETGSVVHTDGLPAYAGLKARGYEHEVSVLLGKRDDAAVRLLPRVHRVASLLKRWLLGTHQGAV